ncbi:MAG TPA: BNR-4 repeat-containing protein [Verrucomicrobiae bacterium]|nr:BNR-4 repeat-containing protein [Verrucomicrobiae bacterium]
MLLTLALGVGFRSRSETADGYRGIWYMNQPSHDEYRYKYSGGFATYPQQHMPIAIYSPEAQKTFFCYGGTTAQNGTDKQVLLHMVSYYDHRTHRVPRPVIVLNKNTSDAHDNPVMSIDGAGYIYIFSPSHGTARPSFIHRSKKPYHIREWELLWKGNFSYPEPWYVPGHGFLFLHTRYASGRNLFSMTSQDARVWSKPEPLVKIDMGDYQISWRSGERVGTAFDFHPRPLGLNGRANIYYMETRDFGKTWQTADGKPVSLVVTNTSNPTLVYDSRADHLLVYLKDLNFDAAGNPVILFLTSKGYASGPKNNPRIWQTARWTGAKWEFRKLTTSDNNYDHGSLYIEKDGTWRVIAPTAAGPQQYNPGGQMVMWTSKDQGKSWKKVKQLTHAPRLNHTYARRPFNANPEFYALWADGNAREPSDSSLYFTDQAGDHVWRLPRKMTHDFEAPEMVQ